MTTFKLTSNAQTVQRDDGAVIPNDPANTDFQAYIAWVAAGNTPEPYVAPPAPAPSVVSRRQFYQAAAVVGLITEAEAQSAVAIGAIPSGVEAVIDALPTGEQFAAKMLVIGAQGFDRSNPVLLAVASAMGRTSGDLDALFTLAATL